MDLLHKPFIQLVIYLGILIFVTLLSRLKSDTVISYGVNIFLLWLVIATFAGISSRHQWSYFGVLLISFVFACIALWGCVILADKLGSPSMSEGAIMLITPLTATVILFTSYNGFKISLELFYPIKFYC